MDQGSYAPAFIDPPSCTVSCSCLPPGRHCQRLMRVASFLLHDLARQVPGPQCSLELSITHREMAKILGATPGALKKMSEDGLLQVDGRKITVLDREALKELAEGG